MVDEVVSSPPSPGSSQVSGRTSGKMWRRAEERALLVSEVRGQDGQAGSNSAERWSLCRRATDLNQQTPSELFSSVLLKPVTSPQRARQPTLLRAHVTERRLA